MGKYTYYARSVLDLLFGFKNWPDILRIFLGKDNTGGKSEGRLLDIRLRKSDAHFKVRGKMDVWSLKEALINQFYTPQGYEPQDGWVIVDIGAGIGEYTLQAAGAAPGSQIYAYEPFPGSYQILMENVHINHADNVRCFQKAVWSYSGRLVLDLSSGEPLQLTSQPASEFENQPGFLVVDCLSLGDVLQTNQIPHIDLLKLDCEGAEYSILLGASPETLICVERIVMEYHDQEGSHHHSVLVGYLQSQGYSVRTETNQVHSDLGYLYASRSSTT